jgi:hypothetical protein
MSDGAESDTGAGMGAQSPLLLKARRRFHMKDKNYKTSVAYMLEIARGDIERHAVPDSLRTYQHDPAPESFGTSKITAGRSTDGLNAGAASAGSGTGAGIVRETNAKNQLAKSSEVIDFLGQASNYGKNIAKVFRHGINLTLRLPHSETTGDVLRRARISCWRMGKALTKAADAFETAHQVWVLATNFQAARGKMHMIIMSPRDPWDVKIARLGAELAAVSLKTIAQIAWEVPHQSIGYARTAAAFLGTDVTHPAFDPSCSWRTWASWQAVSFLDARIGYLTETVYDGDTIYAFIHTHVR